MLHKEPCNEFLHSCKDPGCEFRRYSLLLTLLFAPRTTQLNRTAAYFEYPSTVAILLREVRYGIRLGFSRYTQPSTDLLWS